MAIIDSACSSSMKSKAVAISVLDIIRNVLKAARADAPLDGEEDRSLAAALAYLEKETTPGWFAETVAGTETFKRALQAKTVAQLLTQCTDAASARQDDEGEGPPLAEVRAVLHLLESRWKGADLGVDEGGDDDEQSSSYKYGKTVQALTKAVKQLPMVTAVQSALQMFPEHMLSKLDAQAATVGESVRKTQQQQRKNGAAMQPAEMMSHVMSNPAFMEMMKTMMEDSAAEAAAPPDDRGLNARLALIEMRLRALEAKDKPAPPITAGRPRNKKKKGSGR